MEHSKLIAFNCPRALSMPLIPFGGIVNYIYLNRVTAPKVLHLGRNLSLILSSTSSLSAAPAGIVHSVIIRSAVKAVQLGEGVERIWEKSRTEKCLLDCIGDQKSAMATMMLGESWRTWGLSEDGSAFG